MRGFRLWIRLFNIKLLVSDLIKVTISIYKPAVFSSEASSGYLRIYYSSIIISTSKVA